METYSVLKVIGEGSFGRALLVLCKNSQEKYVMKEIHLPKVCLDKYVILCFRYHYLCGGTGNE